MLERHGLQVRAALLFDRPTPQQTEDGLADWIRMFDKAPFAGVSEELQLCSPSSSTARMVSVRRTAGDHHP